MCKFECGMKNPFSFSIEFRTSFFNFSLSPHSIMSSSTPVFTADAINAYHEMNSQGTFNFLFFGKKMDRFLGVVFGGCRFKEKG
jgi:hypothetical protein